MSESNERFKVGDRVRQTRYPKETGLVREVKPGFVFVRLGDYPEDDPCWMANDRMEKVGDS